MPDLLLLKAGYHAPQKSKKWLIDTFFERITCNELNDYLHYLNCDIFDTTYRQIGGERYYIFCDDGAFFANEPIITAATKDSNGNWEPELAGNLIFANLDMNKGETKSLTEADVINIMNSTQLFVKQDEATPLVHAAVYLED